MTYRIAETMQDEADVVIAHIKDLEAENERLRDALEDIVNGGTDMMYWEQVIDRAKQALQETE